MYYHVVKNELEMTIRGSIQIQKFLMYRNTMTIEHKN